MRERAQSPPASTCLFYSLSLLPTFLRLLELLKEVHRRSHHHHQTSSGTSVGTESGEPLCSGLHTVQGKNLVLLVSDNSGITNKQEVSLKKVPGLSINPFYRVESCMYLANVP